MARVISEFDKPESFMAGAIGLPGERTFYLQVKDGRRSFSVSLEKEQVSLLAARILEMIAGRTSPQARAGSSALDLPLVEEFRVGVLGLAFNNEEQLVIVEAQAITESSETLIEEDDEDGPDLLRVQLTIDAAFEFATGSQAVVSAGRPPCPFCGIVLDPSGHVCPRANGYRR
ncbi:MAG: DUF3090 family protein [Actinobacteria bacterium]|jgi:uncharacterized repeat protein (TIGR03847 family)|nr:DUF3090 family protein [Actinomycetota bacterium]NBP90817.1 DUF3090 family protein [Actinomycetota bacterium]